MAAKAQIDALHLHQLFPTREEAFADGIQKARLRAEAQKTFNTDYPFLNEDLDNRMALITGTDKTALKEAGAVLEEHLTAIRKKKETSIIATTLEAIAERPCPYYTDMLGLLDNMNEAQTAQALITYRDQLQALMDENLAFTRSNKQPSNPSFSGEKSTGWQVKVGTYKDGDQKATTKFGQTCWNAWWSTTRQDATMEIRQTVTNLPEGYYQMECKAMTEHFCISDQHGYIRSGGKEAVTPVISKGYFDMPVEDHWETLVTTPIYVAPKGSLTIGFVSSKQGAEKGKWHKFGEANASSDNREGWWCATDFVLMYHPIDDETGIKTMNDERRTMDDNVYNLAGQLVGKSRGASADSHGMSLPKGIYIQNGKKIIVK